MPEGMGAQDLVAADPEHVSKLRRQFHEAQLVLLDASSNACDLSDRNVDISAINPLGFNSRT
jgi:hypothetical protein